MGAVGPIQATSVSLLTPEPTSALYLANCSIYSTALDLTARVNDLTAAGVLIDPDDLATVSPLITSKIRRFGDWKLDLTPPPPVPAALDLEIGV